MLQLLIPLHGKPNADHKYQHDAYIYMIIAVNKYCITMRFSINVPTVICYPPYVAYMRDAARDNYALWVYSLINLQTLLLPHCLYLTFILFCNL